MNYLEMEGQTDGEYITKLRKSGEWMSSKELQAYSQIFETPIFCAHKLGNRHVYQRYPHPNQEDVADNETCIYIGNYPLLRHFQVVITP